MPKAKRQPRAAEPLYFAHVVPGLEDLASAELTKLGATVRETLAGFDKRDSIVIFSAPAPELLIKATLVEDVFALMADAPTPGGPRGARALAAQIDRSILERAMLAHHAARPKTGGRSFKAVARVAGKQMFLREEAEAAFARHIGALLPRWTEAKGKASLEVWVQIAGVRSLAGLRISGDEMAQRRYKSAHLPASLKPTVARALVVMSDPRRDDVFCDPMCGAGTILRERADSGRAAMVVGGDIEGAAVDAALSNAGRSARLLRWDASRLPLGDRSVDVIVCNPPYGRQYEAIRGLDRLYARTTREMARVLRPDGRCVVLTGEPALLFRVLPPAFRVLTRRRMLLRGLPVTAFVMVRA